MAKSLRVYDATTDELLKGDPAPDLIAVSIQVGGDGVAIARFEGGKWVHNAKDLSLPAHEVYVSDKPDPQADGWRGEGAPVYSAKEVKELLKGAP